MKIKRPKLKRYITILLDENEIEKRRLAKLSGGKKLSDRKIYMAMVDALQPATTAVQPVVEEE